LPDNLYRFPPFLNYSQRGFFEIYRLGFHLPHAAGGKVELHLGSPDGTLIGKSEFLEPSDKGGFAPRPISAPIKEPNDFDGQPQDLYVVFTKNRSENPSTMMVVLGAEFKMAQGPKPVVQ